MAGPRNRSTLAIPDLIHFLGPHLPFNKGKPASQDSHPEIATPLWFRSKVPSQAGTFPFQF